MKKSQKKAFQDCWKTQSYRFRKPCDLNSIRTLHAPRQIHIWGEGVSSKSQAAADSGHLKDREAQDGRWFWILNKTTASPEFYTKEKG